VEQTADRLAPLGELVVDPSSLVGLRNVNPNLSRPEVLECLGAGLQDELHAASEDDGSGAVLEKLLDVSHLYARYVVRTGLSPVPRSAAAWPELQVASASKPFRFDLAPSEMNDTR
jgi:hypothetical protein